MLIMTCGEQSSWGLFVWSKAVHRLDHDTRTAKQWRRLCNVGVGGGNMTTMAILQVVVVLSTLLWTDLDHVAAATSTRTSRRQSETTLLSDHQYSNMQRPEIVVMDDRVERHALNQQKRTIGLDEDSKEKRQVIFEPQASEVQRGALFRRQHQAKNKKIAERKQTNEDYESTKPPTLSLIAVQKDRILNEAMDGPPGQGSAPAGHINDDSLNGKAKRDDAGEVVVTEERDEDKKLIPDYNLGEPIKDWNQKRQEWASKHPEVKQEQLFILTGTQPWPCHNAEGDHLLLRCFKNKVDYSRIHGVGLFYNTALLDAYMPTFWAKLPVVRATMLAHPEVEWIWWLDADAIITDMEFSIPLHRYSAYNLVVHGWESLVFEKRSWLGLNAGSFLLRNCQWSLDLLERWASMGPKAPMGDAYRYILSDFLPDRPRNPTDDQAALVFLLIKERERWASKLRVELDFFLSGYWLELMDGFEATEERYRAMEEQHAELWELLERHGAVGKEKLVAAVGRAREQHLSASDTSVHQRRPFITHFTGCQPCSGHHNNIYSKEQCHTGLLRALNYADNQVLRTLGYQHLALHLPDVLLLPSSAARHAA